MTGPPPMKLLPLMSQIEAWPVLVSCHRMSAWPSPLKSPVPIAFQAGPGLGLTAPPPIGVTSLPDQRLTVGVLQQEVGPAVLVEVRGDQGGDGGDAAALSDATVDHALVEEPAGELHAAAEHVQRAAIEKLGDVADAAASSQTSRQRR